MSTDLLTTLREATEPSRELDARIHAWRMGWMFEHWGSRLDDPHDTGTEYAWFSGESDNPAVIDPTDCYVPHYTSNLQDALELVPEGMDAVVIAGGKQSTANVSSSFSAMRPNPALALATAAVEARMKLGEAA